jgi:hypothetical protein
MHRTGCRARGTRRRSARGRGGRRRGTRRGSWRAGGYRGRGGGEQWQWRWWWWRDRRRRRRRPDDDHRPLSRRLPRTIRRPARGATRPRSSARRRGCLCVSWFWGGEGGGSVRDGGRTSERPLVHQRLGHTLDRHGRVRQLVAVELARGQLGPEPDVHAALLLLSFGWWREGRACELTRKVSCVRFICERSHLLARHVHAPTHLERAELEHRPGLPLAARCGRGGGRHRERNTDRFRPGALVSCGENPQALLAGLSSQSMIVAKEVCIVVWARQVRGEREAFARASL